MKNKEYILVYDSGIGGLTTLSNLIYECPNSNFIYYADTINCPYGNKCKTQIQEIIRNNINKLINQYTISHIVLACNTATTTSIDLLRQTYTQQIIGTEPNIKAPKVCGYKNIILLATPLTIKTSKLKNLEKNLELKVKHKGIKELAKLIEEYKLNDNKKAYHQIKSIISNTLKDTPKSTAIVLGCTHYIFIKEMIEKMGYKCFDGNTGVAKRLKSLVNNINTNHSARIKIITENPTLTYKYKKILSNLKTRIKRQI